LAEKLGWNTRDTYSE